MGRRWPCRGLLQSTAERSTAPRRICLVMPRSQRRIAIVTWVVGWSLIALHKLQSLIARFLETDGLHFPRTVCVMPALKQANSAFILCQAHPVLLRPGRSDYRRPARCRGFEQLVYSGCGSYFFCSILRGGGYAAHCFAGSFADCDLFVGGGVFAWSEDRFLDCAFAGSDARRIIAQAPGERLDDGSFNRHARADRLPAWLSAGAGNRRPAESIPAGADARYRQGLELFSRRGEKHDVAAHRAGISRRNAGHRGRTQRARSEAGCLGRGGDERRGGVELLRQRV